MPTIATIDMIIEIGSNKNKHIGKITKINNKIKIISKIK
jgi:hypothetical protein